MRRRAGRAGDHRGNCPRWRQFLHDVTANDAEFEAYLQRLCGYLLTGPVQEHTMFFLYGPGGTGKSTFLKILSWVMGDYPTTAMMDLFTVEQGRTIRSRSRLCADDV